MGNPLSWSDMQRVKNNYGGFSELFEYLDLEEDGKTTTISNGICNRWAKIHRR